MNFKQIKKKYFKSSEEVISMFLGLVIVVVVGGLIFNYFQKNKGVVNIPGSSDDISLNGELTSAKGSGNYEVVLGDSLWKIAEKKYGNGYAWMEIAKASNLKNPSALEVGQKIVLPEKAMVNGEEFSLVTSVLTDKGASVVPGEEYQVVKNDSLWKIAVEAYGDGYQWTKIWQENKVKLPNANGLEIGMMLMIPKLN
jgi:nucleoid-associated protein YgaU